jgi:AraC-like DNA-binding protein
MVFFLRRVALSLTLLPLSVSSAQSTRPAASTIARLVDSVATLAVAEKLAPALGVAVTMDGRTIYAKSLGMADVSAGVQANDRTLWYLASTSKSFTGFGVSLLAAQGALRFDAPITTLLPRVKWVSQVREMLEEIPLDQLSLSFLAKQVARHPAHVARAFKQRHGVTVGEYMRDRQLAAAAALLRSTELSISTIAHSTGFYDHSQFCHTFRKRTGQTPTEFRTGKAPAPPRTG